MPGKDAGSEEYACGDTYCAKTYRSYTAFYNHCKKSHGGELPKDSKLNGAMFEGPSKNRGRPRIKKNETKNKTEIQSMKKENQLIQFLGTLREKQELIVFVERPTERLETAVGMVEQWKGVNAHGFMLDVLELNQVISRLDLPQFYDPIDEQYRECLDSYSFASIRKFLCAEENKRLHHIDFQSMHSLCCHALVIWLSRNLSVQLLAEVLFTLIQVQSRVPIIAEKTIMRDKTKKFIALFESYFASFSQ